MGTRTELWSLVFERKERYPEWGTKGSYEAHLKRNFLEVAVGLIHLY